MSCYLVSTFRCEMYVFFCCVCFFFFVFVFFQAEDGIRDLVRSRGLGDVYKRQLRLRGAAGPGPAPDAPVHEL